MKKLIFLFLTVLIVACSSEDSNTNGGNNSGGNNSDDVDNPCVYNPTLTTSPVTNVTQTSAILNGVISIVSENCEEPTNTEQGFVYSIEVEPTIANNKVNVNGIEVTTTLENLEPNTMYYVRTYLTNTFGEFYGNEVSFITEDIPELLNSDGNPVPTIVYGTQEWTVEDFDLELGEQWQGDEWNGVGWAYFENNPDNHKVYSGLVVPLLSLPGGWHVPTIAEWEILRDYLIANGYNYDGTTTGNKIGKAMASTTGWYKRPDTGAIGNDQSSNNSSGFNAPPTGWAESSGGGNYQWIDGGGEKQYWSNTYETSGCCLMTAKLESGLSSLYINSSGSVFMRGLAIRLVRDL